MRLLLCLALAVLTFPPPARAEDDCSANQAAMNECAANAYIAADEALDARAKEIAKRLSRDPDIAAKFTAAEHAWESFREAECTFSGAAVAEGTIYPTIYAGCLEDMTKTRMKDLKAYLACEEGDLACPVPAQ